ncbi:unnamed protein product [Cylicocyclus nassatus]|uniref:Uncharacterized protein n=1 Tax=Cylicocyclus nassatus TaxID=53992 RepID=A0AA36M3Z2_CYLNA|nr:unnamed protein product [Cylicocyclus nassatus]
MIKNLGFTRVERYKNLYPMPQSEYLWKGMASDEPVSFTDAGDLSGAAKPTGEQGVAEGQAEQKGSQDKGPSGSSESAEKTKTRRRKKKKKRKTKRKRKRDRYESQNFLLRIEGTLCCASIVIAFVWAATMFLALLAFLVWANFSMSATIQSAKEEWAS